MHIPTDACARACARARARNRAPWAHGLVLAGVLAAAVLAPPRAAGADSESARGYLLKAAFVYNFAKFVEWPATAFATDRSPLIVCIHGHEAFIQFAAAMNGKSIANRPIEVFDAHRSGAPATCHIAFSDDDEDADPKDIDHLVAAGGLSVSDARNFVRNGGMVGLITVENKMRFEVNLAASRRAGLRISAALLRLAKSVIE